jgi:hypothetical protein
MPRAPRSSSSVTVATNDFTLPHLLEHLVPGISTYSRADIECLLTDVVELEYQRVCFTAINAWVFL